MLLLISAGCEINQQNGQPGQVADKESAANPEKAEKAAADQCQNPYYPIKTDTERRYNISGTESSSYILSQSRSGESFKETRSFPDSGLKVVVNWKCLPGGLRTAEFQNLASMKNANFQMQTLESSGITLPKRWDEGKKWKAEYTVRADLRAGPAAGGADGRVTLTSEIVTLKEQVSVPAGDFEAARVDSELIINLRMKGRKIPASKITMSGWYAPEIGLVKLISKSQFGDETIEYTGTR